MVFVIHGDDLEASYLRLSELLREFEKITKLRLPAKASLDQINDNIFTKDLLSTQKVVVLEDFLSSNLKTPKNFFANIPNEIELILWEKTNLTPAKLKKLPKETKVEQFKQKTQLFYFLDSLTQNKKQALFAYSKLEAQESGILWHIQNRLLLLVLAKLGMNVDLASQIIKRPIFDWQWQKLQEQVRTKDLQSLHLFFNATLRADNSIKNGKTNLKTAAIIPILLLKYL